MVRYESTALIAPRRHVSASAPRTEVDAYTSRWYVGSNASQWTVCANSTPSCLRSTFLLPQRVISTLHMSMMKNSAFVGNTGHFDNEIDMADPEGWEGMKVDNIKPQEIVSSSPLNTV